MEEKNEYDRKLIIVSRNCVDYRLKEGPHKWRS